MSSAIGALASIILSLTLTAAASAQILSSSDFESGLGDWANGGGDDFDWTWYSNGTPSSGTGPSGDHTTGSGFYVYTEASTPNYPNKTAYLEGPCIDLTTEAGASWSFWYHMEGAGMGTLHAEVASDCDPMPSWTSVFNVSGHQGGDWLEANVDLTSRAGSQFKIRFRGVTGSSFTSDMAVDDVRVIATSGQAQAVVDLLDFDTYKQHIANLSSSNPPINGSRQWDEAGNTAALDYIQTELESYGYTVYRHEYTFVGPEENIYATKVGTLHPDQMIIIGAHMDSFNTQSTTFAPGADDDASGTALVLQAAEAFGDSSVSTEYSVRFALWNNEETGLDGSQAYVADRAPLQGVEDPPSSGVYPEPTWLLMVQHDMMLWDHGLNSGPEQIPAADVDIEFRASSTFATQAEAYADQFELANVSHAPAYPAEVTNDMNFTDSVSFMNLVPAISLRENRRVAEIPTSNPNWHKNSDVYATYSEEDFLLGFTAAQTTVGAVAQIAGATVAGSGALVPALSPSNAVLTALLMLAAGAFALARRRI